MCIDDFYILPTATGDCLGPADEGSGDAAHPQGQEGEGPWYQQAPEEVQLFQCPPPGKCCIFASRTSVSLLCVTQWQVQCDQILDVRLKYYDQHAKIDEIQNTKLCMYHSLRPALPDTDFILYLDTIFINSGVPQGCFVQPSHLILSQLCLGGGEMTHKNQGI